MPELIARCADLAVVLQAAGVARLRVLAVLAPAHVGLANVVQRVDVEAAPTTAANVGVVARASGADRRIAILASADVLLALNFVRERVCGDVEALGALGANVRIVQDASAPLSSFAVLALACVGHALGVDLLVTSVARRADMAAFWRASGVDGGHSVEAMANLPLGGGVDAGVAQVHGLLGHPVDAGHGLQVLDHVVGQVARRQVVADDGLRDLWRINLEVHHEVANDARPLLHGDAHRVVGVGLRQGGVRRLHRRVLRPRGR
mmetsp:Transcript_86368/g.249445  ORF Transcript_86368/g.249445 Transcript_86368/m.249445 type:complete len:263 (-) Transcript_86368:330-1118(-)